MTSWRSGLPKSKANASPSDSLMLRYLLDTNLCIYVIKRRPESLLERFNQNQDPDLFTVRRLEKGL